MYFYLFLYINFFHNYTCYNLFLKNVHINTKSISLDQGPVIPGYNLAYVHQHKYVFLSFKFINTLYQSTFVETVKWKYMQTYSNENSIRYFTWFDEFDKPHSSWYHYYKLHWVNYVRRISTT